MNLFYLLEVFGYEADRLFRDPNMLRFFFLRILWANTGDQELLISAAVSVIEYEYFRYPVRFDRKAQLIHKHHRPLRLMDGPQARTGQNQLIILPAQPFGVHYLDDPMRVPRIHARKHEERDIRSLT
jgi:hypothetical protein